MDRPPGLLQVTTYGLREMAGFFRHMAAACEHFETTGVLPASLFPATTQGQSPVARAAPSARDNPSLSTHDAFTPSAFAPPAGTPRPHKRRKSEKRTRPPTGYNLFMRSKLESLKREGTYAEFPDSKVRFARACSPDQVVQAHITPADTLACQTACTLQEFAKPAHTLYSLPDISPSCTGCVQTGCGGLAGAA